MSEQQVEIFARKLKDLNVPMAIGADPNAFSQVKIATGNMPEGFSSFEGLYLIHIIQILSKISDKYFEPMQQAEFELRLAELMADFQKKADEIVAQGFYKTYAKEVDLLAQKPTVENLYAKAIDTAKVWFWQRTSAAGVTPVTGTWTDTGLSELDQAKNYTNTYIKKNTHKVGLIELVPTEPITYPGIGVNGSLKIQNDIRYTSIAIPIPPDTDITLWNTSNITNPSAGGGVSFHTELPPSDSNSVAALPNHVSFHGSDLYIQTKTPKKARFLVLNKTITSLNFDVSWKVQTGYGLDKNKVFSPYTLMLENQLAVPLKVNSADNLYSKEQNTTTKYYVSLTQNVVSYTDAKPNWRMAAIPVEPGATYKIYIPAPSEQVKPAWLIDTLSLIAGTPITPVSLTALGNNWFSCTAPQKTTLILANVDLDSDYPMVKISDKFKIIKVRDADNKGVSHIAGTPIVDLVARANSLASETTGDVNIYKQSMNTTGYYISVILNTIQPSSAGKVAVVPIKGGVRYKLKYNAQPNDIFRFRFMVDSTVVADKATIEGLNEVIISSTERDITAPEGTNYMVLTSELINQTFNFSIVSTLQIFDYSKYEPTDVEVIQLNNMSLQDVFARKKIEDLEKKTELVKSNLTNKKWLVIGDSITEKNYRSNYNYHYYLAQTVGGMTVYNYGISGTGFFNRFDVASKITQTDVDLITIFLGTNDYGNQTEQNRKPLGVFGDLDTTTISGCINKLLMDLINKFPLKPIALITPLPMAGNYGLNAEKNAYGYNLKDLVDLLEQYAKHYSLPLFDLYIKSNLYPWLEASNDYYFKAPNYAQGDGLHPNDEGHKLIARKLQLFMESL